MMAHRVAAGVDRFSPKQLFAPGTLGIWYDPCDLATLSQDIAGTIPVTAVGQSVGRMRDKSPNALHAVGVDGQPFPVLRRATNGAYYLDFDTPHSQLVWTMPTAFNNQSNWSLLAAVHWRDVVDYSRGSAVALGEGNWTAAVVVLGVGSYPTPNVINFSVGGAADYNSPPLAFPRAAVQAVTKNGWDYIYRMDGQYCSGGNLGRDLAMINPVICNLGRNTTTMKVRLYGGILVDTVLGEIELNQTERWLARRNGVTW